MVAGQELLNNPDAITTGITNATISFGSTLYLIIWIFLGLLIVGGVFFFVWWFNSFKHTVKIKEKLGSGRYLTLHDKAKIKKTKEGEFWLFRRRRALIGAPPADALEITTRGAYYAECVHDNKSGLDAGYDWVITNSVGTSEVQQTQEERALLADRLRRAEARKSRSTLEVIMQLSGMIMCIMIVFGLLAFYGEITQSLEDANREQQAAFAKMEGIIDKQIQFQDSLNNIFEQLDCSIPSAGINIPLDQQVRTD